MEKLIRLEIRVWALLVLAAAIDGWHSWLMLALSAATYVQLVRMEVALSPSDRPGFWARVWGRE